MVLARRFFSVVDPCAARKLVNRGGTRECSGCGRTGRRRWPLWEVKRLEGLIHDRRDEMKSWLSRVRGEKKAVCRSILC